MVLEEIRKHIDNMKKVTVSFVYREENAVADALAKEASKRSFGNKLSSILACNNTCSHFIWDLCPLWLHDVIVKDTRNSIRLVLV